MTDAPCRPQQVPMDLILPIAKGADDFVVSASNRAAWDAISMGEDGVDRRMALSGPAGCGKSHLLSIWASDRFAEIVPAADLEERHLAALMNAEAIAIDDVDAVADRPLDHRRPVEAVLFHLINHAGAERKPLLLTGRSAPSRWAFTMPDLVSRLSAMRHVPIAEPDDELLSSILRKLFADRQMIVGDDVIAFLCLRMERTHAAAVTLVDAIDRMALAGKRAVTRPFVRYVMAALESSKEELAGNESNDPG